MKWKVQDHYFKKAKKDNFLARSAYKIQEIDQKFKIIKKNDHVLDLGYFPGSWIQYVHSKLGEKGSITGVDIQPINKKLCHYKKVKLFEKSIFDIENPKDLNLDKLFDIILSDMAPSTTGIRSVDQDRSLALVESVFCLLPNFLKERGNFVIKVFDSHSVQSFLKSQKNNFKDFKFFKPKSTRPVSKEFFVIGKNYCGN